MTSDKQHKPQNLARRALGVALCFLPVFFLLASIAFGLVCGRPLWSAGLGFIFAACFFAAINFYLSFMRGLLFRLFHGSMEGYRYVSGIPIVGSVLVLIGTAVGFGAIGTAMLGLVCIALDTGGSVWFLIATWRDSSLWDS